MKSKPVFPHSCGLDMTGPVLGVTEEFDDLQSAEFEALEQIDRIRQPTTRRTDGHGPVGETG